MNVLLVTDQIIKIENNKCICVTNFYDIVQRFLYLGNLRICCKGYYGKCANKIDTVLDFIDTSQVRELSNSRLFTTSKDNAIIEEEVQKADLVIGYNPSKAGVRAYGYARKYQKKYMTLLVACPWDALWNHGIMGKLLAPYKYLKNKYVVKKSDYVIYVTNKFLQNRYPNNKLNVGCSNVRIPTMNKITLENRLKFIDQSDLEKEIRIVTSGAVYVRYKGQEYVIRALGKLKEMGLTHYHYYLMGGGSTKFLESVALKCGVQDQVHFMGALPHKQVFETLDTMHVYIQPSLQEGLPRSMVEAMSRGLFCSGARTAAIPELIESRFVCERKSVDDIVRVLTSISKDILKDQAKRNFEEAKKYQEEIVNDRRNRFFDLVISDVEGGKHP